MRPKFLYRMMAEIAAEKAAMRKPGDPVEYKDISAPGYDVRMPARDSGVIITHVPEADEWCREQCRSAWGRAIDRGPGRDGCVPVYRFASGFEAFWFGFRFR